jgi:hypothetical protein
VLELRINDVPGRASGARRVEVMWRDGAARRVAATEFAGPDNEQDQELIRWYVEDYAEFPADPAPAIAADAEARLAKAGIDLFGRVFSSADAVGIWERVRDRLSEIRVEVETDLSEGPGLTWELLRDPSRDAAVALSAKAFVRTHLRAAGHPDLPEPSGNRLRVLMVICRPDRDDDVPFRSVASHLIRGGANQIEGLDLDVLRPPTFSRLSEVLHAAFDAGQPYHVVHFDGHGVWLDLAELGIELAGMGTRGGGIGLTSHKYQVSVLGSIRQGKHGYLLFEDPDTEENQQLADGPTLGRLLVDTGVPVLVLNACRSAYAEAPAKPCDADTPVPADSVVLPTGEDAAGLEGEDVHARIRAYGSLAEEIADAGVPGVVAMRYNVYVVTAAQFVADLYGYLMAGLSLGEAATAARKALAANPTRQISTKPVALQDWVVPVVYEAAPLVLLHPERHPAPVIGLTPFGGSPNRGDAVLDGLPRAPDVGFLGRDETLLALDRAFDTHNVVLLYAYAGAGKSSTVAEFARWYQATGGLDDSSHRDWGPSALLWSSFERHLTADQLVSRAAGQFADLLEANGIHWQAITSPAQRRALVLQVLKQMPTLWVWDNIEPVTGFPPGTRSDWTTLEQDDLAHLLRDLSQQTRCKVLLTSRREEYAWLCELPARVRLPAMPIRESLQLVSALAVRRGRRITGGDWRPLLRYAAGNPLTITVLVGQALRENLSSSTEIQNFVTRLQAGELQLEATDNLSLGRTRSLAASLNYGFVQAFTSTEHAQLAVLHLFRGTVFSFILRAMGMPGVVGEDAVPELAGMELDTREALFDRAADIGLLTPLGRDYYQIHPALPWYFASLFTTVYGKPGNSASIRASRAYAKAIGALCLSYTYTEPKGPSRDAETFGPLLAEEANLLHALEISRAHKLYDAEISCLFALDALYNRTGRSAEWAQLLTDVAPDFTDPITGGPLPGVDYQNWGVITQSRAQIAREMGDLVGAAALQASLIESSRTKAAGVLAVPAARLTDDQRREIRNYLGSLCSLGNTLMVQDDPGCLPYLEESLALSQRIDDRQAEATNAGALCRAYLDVPKLYDLDLAERWCRHSLSIRADGDRRGRAANLADLGRISRLRFEDALRSRQDVSVLAQHMETAFRSYYEALDLTPVTDHRMRGELERGLGHMYEWTPRLDEVLRHFQQSIRHDEACGDIASAGGGRYAIARFLALHDRASEALLYARAALDNYRRADLGPNSDVAAAEQLIAKLEHRALDNG